MTMISNVYLMIFAVAMTGCVLATPFVTWVAGWVGAVDRPDQFRRIHHGAIPRLGGFALALGVAVGVLVTLTYAPLRERAAVELATSHHWPILVAALVVLFVGFIDDTRSVGPRMKLLGQGLAVLALYLGGIRIQTIAILNLNIDLGFPSTHFQLLGFPIEVALPSLLVTLFWFLGCMNIWNLIDGMDGLASGVGLLVSGTLTLVAIHNENFAVAVLAVALAGSLAGFLLYNWHPACIFLGDSGAMLIGLLIGVIGVEGSLEGPSAISILFPILAMGLPISDTAMAIFRRWVRNLPLSAADRRHVHHLLIGLGLNPRQAALMLYCFSGFLCGAVMLGVALRNEYLTLVLGISGCLVFLLVVTSRRDELSNLRDDLHERLARKRQEREAAKLAWEAIQRIELCTTARAAYEILDKAAQALGCSLVQIACGNDNSPVASPIQNPRKAAILGELVSGPSAIFRLSSGRDLWITVSLGLPVGSATAADIAFRYLQRLSQALADRLERIEADSTIAMEIGPEPLELKPGRARPISDEGKPRRAGVGLSVLAVVRSLARSLMIPGARVEPRGPSRPAADSWARPASGARG
jgi:UDP-GlcNAc:undecaprenyl-phosphate/decaprenyl-phosphate GlcNAc-1-phosphate transferase